MHPQQSCFLGRLNCLESGDVHENPVLPVLPVVKRKRKLAFGDGSDFAVKSMRLVYRNTHETDPTVGKRGVVTVIYLLRSVSYTHLRAH